MASSETPQPVTGADVQTVETVARSFLSVAVWCGVQPLVVLMAGVIIVRAVTHPWTPFMAYLPVLSILWLAGLGSLVAMGVYMHRTMAAMSSLGDYAYVVGMLFPCINVVVLLLAGSAVKKWCRAVGLAAGPLGPTPQAISDLRAATATPGHRPPAPQANDEDRQSQ